MSDNKVLMFAPFASIVDAGFWFQLTKLKLDVLKLSDAPVPICGFYSNNSASQVPIANIDYSAFENDAQIPPKSFPMLGTLMNTNTLEDFKAKDKKELIQGVGQKVWECIVDGSALENPTLLQQVLCLTFADLKKYHYYYWLAYPAFTSPEFVMCGDGQKIDHYLSDGELNTFLSSYDALPQTHKAAFLISKTDEGVCEAHKLNEYKSLKSKDGKILLGFSDPSNFEKFPGWPLRNLLSLAAYYWGREQSIWDVLCFKEIIADGKRVCKHSTVITVQINAETIPEACPDVVGWSKNKSKQLAPEKVDMSNSMDPTKLADSAVDLNLKLMRWRLVPELNLSIIKSTKCLLFGAGTLGCNVARCLMGWGVRKITLVDNSNVSYSNPVRQTLFNFEDCLQGGRPKAIAAAEALKRIFPNVVAEGKVLSVPMPGHSISEKTLDQVRKDVSEIEDLIESHDVIFLLMDTRESRWLPTLIGAAKQKIVLNAALGFDTFLVMRHGFKQSEAESPSGDEAGCSKKMEISSLGCYFCNDVVAPGNSVQDRTLDQQCTVTRPGISYVASALVVELMVSILQHPKQAMAPAATIGLNDSATQESSTVLGIVPHQIRGYLDRFQNTLLTSKAFDRCTACSTKVVEGYRKLGFDFLLKVFNDPNYLEEITGLTELMSNIQMDEVFALSDDEDSP